MFQLSASPRRLFAVGIHADDALLHVLPRRTLAHLVNGIEQSARTMETPGHVGVAVGPNPAHVGGFQFSGIAGDFEHLERGVASEVRLPCFHSAVASIFVPAGGLSFAGHLKVFDAHDVARTVRAHRELGPAVDAPPEIHQPRAVRRGDAHRLEFGLFVFQRRHLREQMIIGPVHHGGGGPTRIVETDRLPAGGFPARIKLNGRAIARSAIPQSGSTNSGGSSLVPSGMVHMFGGWFALGGAQRVRSGFLTMMGKYAALVSMNAVSASTFQDSSVAIVEDEPSG